MSTPGTYILLLHLPGDTSLQIGKLGQFIFPAGFYAYVGSAFGTGGLAGRLKHHLKRTETPHWHIDYLRQVAEIEEIWLTHTQPSREHAWAEMLLSIPGGTIIAEKFGASDCNCESHLIYFDIRPDIEDFKVTTKYYFHEDIIIRAYSRENGKENNIPN